ncbi:histidine kinase, partial [Rhizobium sullae]
MASYLGHVKLLKDREFVQDKDYEGIASPIRELRRLYRDAEAKAARLRLIVDVRKVLDRGPLDTAMYEALSAIAGFAGASTATIRSQTGTAWQFPTRSAAGEETAEGADPVAVCKAWIGCEMLELRLSRLAFPMNEQDREAIQIVTDQLAAFLAAESQRILREQLTSDLQARERDLARLIEAMIGAQEQERRRIAYDLHDGVAQSLASLLFRLEAAVVAMEDTQSAKDAIEGGIEIVRTSIGEV